MAVPFGEDAKYSVRPSARPPSWVPLLFADLVQATTSDTRPLLLSSRFFFGRRPSYGIESVEVKPARLSRGQPARGSIVACRASRKRWSHDASKTFHNEWHRVRQKRRQRQRQQQQQRAAIFVVFLQAYHVLSKVSWWTKPKSIVKPSKRPASILREKRIKGTRAAIIRQPKTATPPFLLLLLRRRRLLLLG